MFQWPTTFHFKKRLAHSRTKGPAAAPSPDTVCRRPSAILRSIPCEILYLIFSELSFKDCVRCMRVCKAWRSIILDWSDLWRTLSTRHGCDIGSDLTPYGACIRARAVRKVYFDYTDLEGDTESTAPMTRMIDFLTKQACSNIHEAVVNGYFDTPATFTRFASLTSKSLVHLVIKSHDNEISTLQVLNTVLTCYPQLQTLVCCTVGGWSSEPSMHLLKNETASHSNLTELTIKVRRQVQLPLHNLVKHFPKLQFLAVPPGNCENVDQLLDALDQSCSDIESIRITTSDVTSSLLRLGQPAGYLRELVVSDYRLPVAAAATAAAAAANGNGTSDNSTPSPSPPDHLHGLLKKHSATLELLSLGDATALNQATMALLASLDFPSLQTYTRSTGVHDPKPFEYNPDHLCAFLSRCPRLETIDLVDRGTNDQVLECLQSLPSLRSLQLQYSDQLSSSALSRFLKSHPLEHLSLHSIQAMSDPVLCVLNTRRLRSLRITLCKQISVGAGLRPLVASIPSRLEELEVTCVLTNTDTGILLESVLSAMNKVASRWKLKLHRQNDYYPHPALSLITDVHWKRRQSYYRQILVNMERT